MLKEMTGALKAISILALFGLGISACSPKDEASQESEAAIAQEVPTPVDPGKAIYDQNCLICHQSNGSGVPGLQPSLVGSEWAQGNPERLARLVLIGSSGFDEVSGDEYGNIMPGFLQLSDTELASVLSYVRRSFGNEAEPIPDSLVANVRARL